MLKMFILEDDLMIMMSMLEKGSCKNEGDIKHE